jgi:hypothetical protein
LPPIGESSSGLEKAQDRTLQFELHRILAAAGRHPCLQSLDLLDESSGNLLHVCVVVLVCIFVAQFSDHPYSQGHFSFDFGPTGRIFPAFDAALDRIEIPQDVVEQISELLTPGSSLIISDYGMSSETREDTDFIVVAH